MVHKRHYAPSRSNSKLRVAIGRSRHDIQLQMGQAAFSDSSYQSKTGRKHSRLILTTILHTVESPLPALPKYSWTCDWRRNLLQSSVPNINNTSGKTAIILHPFISAYYHWKNFSGSFIMLSRTLTYSPVQQIDEDDTASEKPLGHRLNPQIHHKTSQYYRSFWNHHWAYFTHGSLLAISILFFCLWIRTCVQIPRFVYCKSYFAASVRLQTN